MSIKIKRAKLSKGGSVEASYVDADGNEITIKGKNKCHNDLRTAFSHLVPYFADLTEQKEADKIDWDELECAENVDMLRKIEVTGISVGGDDNNRLVTLTGKRTLLTSRVLNLNAPGVEMDSDTFVWPHINNFDIAVQGVLFEVEQYVVNRKWEAEQQQFNFDGDPDDPFAEAGLVADAQPIEEPAEHVA